VTVIAWDGMTLAADKRAVTAGACATVTKIFRRAGFLIGVSGSFKHGMAVADWIEAGGKPDDYPKADKDDASHTLVIHPDGRVVKYEGTPWGFEIEDRFAATGSGRDYALAAMYLGHDARTAVEVTNALSCDCGNGVDTMRFSDP
jgi:ATP-dependent protease HslVU (ClpYQ) peptidase subunit